MAEVEKDSGPVQNGGSKNESMEIKKKKKMQSLRTCRSFRVCESNRTGREILTWRPKLLAEIFPVLVTWLLWSMVLLAVLKIGDMLQSSLSASIPRILLFTAGSVIQC